MPRLTKSEAENIDRRLTAKNRLFFGLANQIKYYRGQKKWSQEKLAKKAGMPVNSIRRWEDGTVWVKGSHNDMTELLVIAEALDIYISADLVPWEDKV